MTGRMGSSAVFAALVACTGVAAGETVFEEDFRIYKDAVPGAAVDLGL